MQTVEILKRYYSGNEARVRKLIDWIERRTGIQLIETQDGELINQDDASFCESCESCFASSRGFVSMTFPRRVEKYVCDSCKHENGFRCADCCEWFSEGLSGGSNAGGDTVCESCSESYFYCEGCNNTCHNDDYGSDGLCADCERASNDEDGPIQDYSSDPVLRPIGNGPHFYGVELEVEADGQRGDKAKETLSRFSDDFAIAKEDGSLSLGFEIVTRPASLDLQRKEWKRFCDRKPSGLKSFDTTTCGLHVHCSRKPLSDFQIAKIVCFVNSAENRHFVETLAMRKSGKWAEYKEKTIVDAAKRNAARYEAVNLQNSATIEFRIFKGTLKYSSIIRAIELCDALIEYTKPQKRMPLAYLLRAKCFCGFVLKREDRWPELSAYVRRWLAGEFDTKGEI